MLEAQQVSLGRDFARALDPVLLARDCELDPDPIQADLLTTSSRRVLVNCCRQWGKSSITALVALHECLYAAPARVVLVSPSQPQSTELFKKVHDYWVKLLGAPHARQESLTRMELANGSRIISLPGSEKTVRGYSATLIVIDECARCSDELISAVRPMLAASTSGRFIALSTPAGKRGWYFEQWTRGDNWHRVMVKASECPRISPAFLEEEMSALGPLLYGQEYCCEFHDAETSVFSRELIQAALTDDFEPFIPFTF
jgi:Terminase large subunit, T4likevirus-type, N-terminal